MSKKGYASVDGSNGKPAKREKSRAEWQGFVEIQLSAEEKGKVQETVWEPEDYTDFLVNVCEAGYKVSIVRDDFNQCSVASLTGRAEDCINAGLTLSGRGPDVLGALRSLAYKHVVICEELRWDNRAESRAPEAWG